MAHLRSDQLRAMGFSRVGEDVLVSDKASFYNCVNIELGDHVRIDDFCVLSAGRGGISIGSRVHIAVYSSVIGAGRVVLSDYSNISSRVSIYSSSDDYSGSHMTNPMVPKKYTGVIDEDVLIGRHAIVGCGTVILPGSVLEEGAAVGALSLVRGRCLEFGIYAGVPAVRLKDRKRDLLEKEAELLRDAAS